MLCDDANRKLDEPEIIEIPELVFEEPEPRKDEPPPETIQEKIHRLNQRVEELEIENKAMRDKIFKKKNSSKLSGLLKNIGSSF